jgi:hypothetical protein
VYVQNRALTHSIPPALLNPLSSTSQHEVDPSLPPNGSMTFGFGYHGGAPLVFTLDKGRAMESGFLKLFLSAEYIDLSDIEQMSPFGGGRPIGRANVPSKIWDTISVAVVLRKGKEKARDSKLRVSQTRMKQAVDHGHLQRPTSGDADDQMFKVCRTTPMRNKI